MKLEKITAKGANNLFRDRSSQIIYFRKHIKGREVLRSTRTTKLEAAKSFVADLLKTGKPKQTSRSLTALERYETWVESKKTLGLRANTITSMNATKRVAQKFLETMFPDEMTADWWTGIYIPTVRAETSDKRKFFNDRKWFSSFTKHLHETGVISSRPKFENPDKKTTVGKVYADEEIEDLLNFAQNEDLRMAILMAVTMGMRRNEIFALKVQSVDTKGQTISLSEDDTKTKKARAFRVSDDVWPLLKKRLQSGSAWVFPQAGNPDKPLHKDGYKTAWNNLKKICGVKGRFHDLRHTFLTKAFKAPGANPALICHYAGLSLEVAEKVYLHFNADDTKAVASIVSFVDRGKSGVKHAKSK